MAIDGVKIIDGDLAHDIYNSIIDQYDAGVDFQIIRSNFLFRHLTIMMKLTERSIPQFLHWLHGKPGTCMKAF